jgi:hypothetical protein
MVGPFIARLLKWLERYEKKKKQEKKAKAATQKQPPAVVPEPAVPPTRAQGQPRRPAEAQEGDLAGGGGKQKQSAPLGIKGPSRWNWPP